MNGRNLTLGIVAGLAVAGLARSARGSADRERGVLVPISKPSWVRSIFDDSAWFAFSHLPDDVCVERRFSTNMGLFASWNVFTKGRSGQNFQNFSGLLTGNEISTRETLPYCAKGLDALREQMAILLRAGTHVHDIRLASSDGRRLAWLHEHGEVIGRSDDEAGVALQVRLSDADRARFATI